MANVIREYSKAISLRDMSLDDLYKERERINKYVKVLDSLIKFTEIENNNKG